MDESKEQIPKSILRSISQDPHEADWPDAIVRQSWAANPSKFREKMAPHIDEFTQSTTSDPKHFYTQFFPPDFANVRVAGPPSRKEPTHQRDVRAVRNQFPQLVSLVSLIDSSKPLYMLRAFFIACLFFHLILEQRKMNFCQDGPKVLKPQAKMRTSPLHSDLRPSWPCMTQIKPTLFKMIPFSAFPGVLTLQFENFGSILAVFKHAALFFFFFFFV
jgi:hypothetical protein